MKSSKKQDKAKTASTKKMAVTKPRCSKPTKSSRTALKQRRKARGEEASGGLTSTVPPPSPAVPSSSPGQSFQCVQKVKLQLFPIDSVTCNSLEKEKHNPYLELTLGIKKKISSVVKHLDVKWGNSKMASGELMLYPYYARVQNLANCISWSLKDSTTTVADVHASIGKPAVFRLRYGWFSNLEPKVGPNEVCNENTIVESHNHAVPVPFANSIGAEKSENAPINLWELSNISFGALLSEASKQAKVNAINCDTFDADIARLKATAQSTSVPQLSILDAEETCNMFSFQKMSSSSNTQNVSSTQSKPDNLDDACQASTTDQLQRNDSACTNPKPDTTTSVCEEPRLQVPIESILGQSSQFWKQNMNLPDSLGLSDFPALSFTDMFCGDSTGFGAMFANTSQNASLLW